MKEIETEGGVLTEETLRKARKIMEQDVGKSIPSQEDLKEAMEQTKKEIKAERQPGEAPKPTEYQKRLIAQWHETGHSGPAPFASDGKELFWLNRQQRRARAAIARKRK